jgi:hypothetical protein
LEQKEGPEANPDQVLHGCACARVVVRKAVSDHPRQLAEAVVARLREAPRLGFGALASVVRDSPEIDTKWAHPQTDREKDLEGFENLEAIDPQFGQRLEADDQ